MRPTLASMADRFDTSVYQNRLARAAQLVEHAGLDAIVVSSGPDLQYLLGSRAS